MARLHKLRGVLDADRTPSFLAKESLFSMPAVGWGMRIMRHIPIKRDACAANGPEVRS